MGSQAREGLKTQVPACWTRGAGWGPVRGGGGTPFISCPPDSLPEREQLKPAKKETWALLSASGVEKSVDIENKSYYSPQTPNLFWTIRVGWGRSRPKETYRHFQVKKVLLLLAKQPLEVRVFSPVTDDKTVISREVTC